MKKDFVQAYVEGSGNIPVGAPVIGSDGVLKTQTASGASVVASEAAVQNAVAAALKKITLPAGAAPLTLATHQGAECHAEVGTTSVTLAAADFNLIAPEMFEAEVFNFTGAGLPIVITDFSGGISIDGDTTNDELDGEGTLITVPHAQQAVIRIDANEWVRVRLAGVEVTQAEFEAGLALKRDKYSLGHPFMTAETLLGYSVVASSQHSAPYFGHFAFRKDIGTNAGNEWATASVKVATLTIEAPLPVIFNRVVLRGRSAGTEYPSRWKIQGSNDGMTFTDLLDKSAVDENLNIEKTFDFSNSTPYKFYRFDMINAVGTAPGLSRCHFYHTGIDTVQQDASKMSQVSLGHPEMTAETLLGHTVTQSSQYSAAYAAWRAFNLSISATDEWATATLATATATLESPTPIIFDKVTLIGRSNGTEYPTRWKIEGSNDGTTFTTILDKTAADESLQTEKTFALSYTTPYKYHRFNMTASVGTNPGLGKCLFYRTGQGFAYQDPSKVDKETGKGLSANDFTATLKTKLDGLTAGAEVNVQADWSQVMTTADDFIKNKPIIPAATTVNDTLTSDSATEALSAKQGKALKTAVDGKSPTAHTHAQSDVTGLPAALLAKQDTLTNAQLNALSQIVTTPTRSMPAFAAATATGTAGTYTQSASSEHVTGYFGWKAMKATQGTSTEEWATNAVNTNFWNAILFPTARVITSARVAARMNNVEGPSANWRIEASNNGTTWTTLYTSATAMTNAIEAVSFANATAYTRYRMFASTGTGANPGMSFFELRHDAMGFATAPAV